MTATNGAIIRAVLISAVLFMFILSGIPLLMLAAALCAGAIMGHEARSGAMAAWLVFTLAVAFNINTYAISGVMMTNYFFPTANAGEVVGFSNFIMLVLVGGYFVWALEGVFKFVDKERERLRELSL